MGLMQIDSVSPSLMGQFGQKMYVPLWFVNPFHTNLHWQFAIWGWTNSIKLSW